MSTEPKTPASPAPGMRGQAFASPDSAEFKPAITYGQGLPKERGGRPASYYWKQMLRPGRFVDAEGKEHEVSPARIDVILRDHQRAKESGWEPYLPFGSHKAKDSNLGYLMDVQKRGDGSLWGLHQFIGDPADIADKLARNKSSIFTVRDFKDQNGQQYEEFILHNAILPDPRDSQLSDFEPALAASCGQVVSVDVLQPAAPDNPVVAQSTRSDAMKLTQEQLQAVRELGAADLTEDKASEAITFLLNFGMQQKKDNASLSDRLSKSETRALSLSQALPPELDERMVGMTRRALETEFKEAIASGGISPATAEELKKVFFPEAGKVNGLVLSQSPGSTEPDAYRILGILARNKPVALGDRKGLNLSQRDVPDDKKDDKEPPTPVDLVKQYAADYLAKAMGAAK